jgi:hypothetical protein
MSVACGNINGMIRVVLDEEDRLKSYALLSRPCGEEEVPRPLILGLLRGLSVEEVNAHSAKSLLEAAPHEVCAESEAEDHLRGVQAALAVLTGIAPGGPAAPCAAAEISYADGETLITARLGKDTPQGARSGCGSRCATNKGRRR